MRGGGRDERSLMLRQTSSGRSGNSAGLRLHFLRRDLRAQNFRSYRLPNPRYWDGPGRAGWGDGLGYGGVSAEGPEGHPETLPGAPSTEYVSV